MPRWTSCNILQTDAGATRLWQFEAKGSGFELGREHTGAPGESLLSRIVAKSWTSLWQPKLNVAWLPPENVFLRVIELPKSPFDETASMVELQLEKLSPMPLTQIVWTIHCLPQASEPNLQNVIVVIAERGAVEEFLGKLEGQGYLADRLETPMLDQLEASPTAEDGAWIYAEAHGKNSALVAWRSGGALRNLSLILLPPEGDRAASLKSQLTQLGWAGELEGWLAAPSQWHLIADAGIAAEWENLLLDALGEPVRITQPLPAAELAARTARRAAEGSPRANLLPADFSTHYHQQFVDRLWARGLIAAGVLYAIFVGIYFCAREVLAYRTNGVERQVAMLAGDYNKTLLLKARYDVLKERQDLTYAALDCWKTAAEKLPEALALQRISFADGQKLTLSGTCSPDQIGLITEKGGFYDGVRKATLNGQPMFDSEGGEPPYYRQNGNLVTWNFSLLLKHTEATR